MLSLLILIVILMLLLLLLPVMIKVEIPLLLANIELNWAPQRQMQRVENILL